MGSPGIERKKSALPARALAACGRFGIRIASIDIPSDHYPDLRTLVESEVWIAEDPDHMIHFSGKHFLGPHPDVMPTRR